MQCWRKLKRYWDSTLLCIKYPFLYPRNRFDGKHHNHFEWLCHLINKYYKKAFYDLSFGYKFYKNPSENTTTTKYVDINGRFTAILFDGVIHIYDHAKLVAKFNVCKHVGSKFIVTGITKVGYLSGGTGIQYHVSPKEPVNVNYGFSYQTIPLLKSKTYKLILNIFKKLDNFLDRIFILPYFTELDALDTGWRKAFGLQICEDIKQALLKHGGKKALKRYRIVQIKEKWGYLHWYDNNGCEEVNKIIGHYELVSLKTCIHCGKPATKVSLGWICPYCDDCAPENCENIEEYYKDVNNNEC